MYAAPFLLCFDVLTSRRVVELYSLRFLSSSKKLSTSTLTIKTKFEKLS